MSVAFAQLAKEATKDPLWDVFQIGLGNVDGELEISIRAIDVYSSFKSNSDFCSERFPGAKEAGREVVQVRRLDAFIAENPSALTPKTYLKIDTQGFELEVVDGAGNESSRFQAVQMELALRPLYEGQPPLVDMIKWMQDRGFEIVMVKENGFDHGACRLLELDVAFMTLT